MKGKTKFKNIFIKTGAMFFAFYLIVMTVFTVIYYKAQISEKDVSVNFMFSVLKDNISSDIVKFENGRTLAGRDGPLAISINKLTSLNTDISELTNLNYKCGYYTSLFSKDMLAKGYLYDANGVMFAKSRNLLTLDCEETPVIQTDVYKAIRYIDLDKYLSQEEIIELLKFERLTNVQEDNDDAKEYYVNVQGYVNGVEIIPEVIDIYESIRQHGVRIEERIKNAERIKTYNFNVQGVEGLRKIDVCDYFHSLYEVEDKFQEYIANISKIDKDDNLYKKIFSRYNNFHEYTQEEIKSFDDGSGSIYRDYKNETFSKINYDYINTIQVDGNEYYMVLKAEYYPWEVIIPKAIPLYGTSFIMVLAMVIILSKGLYKTYKKQEALDKNRRELTSAIAHELKTPLGIIRTYGEGLKEKIAEGKKDYYLDVIIDETYKMDTMVLEMLDLSKLEAKAYEIKRETFCINDIVEGIIKKNEKVFNDKRIHINYTSDKKYNIDADYIRIEQVINNLISNAIYHTDENKTINITLDNNKLTIENEGEHIPKDKINLIWDTFYRADNSRDRSERRTGLGLSIVKNIFQLHNMEFGVVNTKIGVKFWFNI
jgi:signal transduction histidine kinase